MFEHTAYIVFIDIQHTCIISIILMLVRKGACMKTDVNEMLSVFCITHKIMSKTSTETKHHKEI